MVERTFKAKNRYKMGQKILNFLFQERNTETIFANRILTTFWDKLFHYPENSRYIRANILTLFQEMAILQDFYCDKCRNICPVEKNSWGYTAPPHSPPIMHVSNNTALIVLEIFVRSIPVNYKTNVN